jgi:hypothetical protein
MPNIWALNDEDQTKAEDSSQSVVSSHEEDELERPSFLRRLRSRSHKEDNDEAAGSDSDKTAQ